MPEPKLIVRWNLRRVAADLAAFFDAVGEADDWGRGDSEHYLEPYGLPPADIDIVLGIAWGVGCRDCEGLDWYMVRTSVWRHAGLKPDDHCCRACLALRLKRPLRPDDFTRCPLNYKQELCCRSKNHRAGATTGA
jgi:hypothetical protein